MSHPAAKTNPNQFSLGSFRGEGYDKGRPIWIQALWLMASGCIVTRWWCPRRVRIGLLRAFGAKIGSGVLIRHDVTIHWPWKLTVGDNSWVGVKTWILNLEPVTIGSDTCISQAVLLCTGSHDRTSPSFEFDNGPIIIGDHVWVAARATVLRGVSIGDGATVGASCLVTSDVPAGRIVLAPRGAVK
jgi:putative colanic acid biosynthesis acetyltransferase WcaF